MERKMQRLRLTVQKMECYRLVSKVKDTSIYSGNSKTHNRISKPS
jgi:hypothetical protein